MNTEAILNERVKNGPAAPKICRFPGCLHHVKARQLCSSHYEQQRRGSELQPLPNPGPPVLCQFPDCDREVRNRGFCHSHAEQRRFGRNIQTIRGTWQPICVFPDCGRETVRNGLCHAHSWQLWRGEDLRPIPERLPPICTFPDCGRKTNSRGLCAAHARQRLLGRELQPIQYRSRRPPCCSVPGCGWKTSAREMCSAHYAQWRKGEPFRPILQRFPLEERFNAYVDRSGPCHIFTGSIDARTGYGKFGKTQAHRFAYTLEHGEIPAGLQTDHLCRVRRCVNVDHCRLATPRQNVLNKFGRPDYSLTDVEGVFFMGRWEPRANRFRAVLSGSGLSVIVGHYPELESAALALEEAKAGYQPPLPGMERLSDVYGVTA